MHKIPCVFTLHYKSHAMHKIFLINHIYGIGNSQYHVTLLNALIKIQKPSKIIHKHSIVEQESDYISY